MTLEIPYFVRICLLTLSHFKKFVWLFVVFADPTSIISAATYEETILALRPMADTYSQGQPSANKLAELVEKYESVVKKWDGINTAEALDQLLSDFSFERYRNYVQGWMFSMSSVDHRTKGDLLARAIVNAKSNDRRRLLVLIADGPYVDSSIALRRALVEQLDDFEWINDPHRNFLGPVRNRAHTALLDYANRHQLNSDINFHSLGPDMAPDFCNQMIARLRKEVVEAHPDHFGISTAKHTLQDTFISPYSPPLAGKTTDVNGTDTKQLKAMSELPQSNPWSTIAVLIVVAGGLLWLLFKRRS